MIRHLLLFNLLTELIARAEQSIILIDGYIDVVTLNILAKKKDQVSVLAYTYPNARITNQDITNFNAQYPTLEVKRSTAFHDRFLILDEKEGYHIGAYRTIQGYRRLESLDFKGKGAFHHFLVQ